MNPQARSGGLPPRAAPEAMPASAARWFVPLRDAGAATRLRIFMFPFAGGGPSSLRGYAAAWPDDMQPYAAQLPGRERRIQEPPLRRAADAVPALAQAVAREFDARPFVLLGHSLGAVLAFETARVLQAMGGPPPARLVVSGFAPGQRNAQPYHRLPDAGFMAALKQLGGTPAEVLHHPALMALMLPTLRADFEMAETFDFPQGPCLHCPIVALAGEDDPEAPPAAMPGWAGLTDGACSVHPVAGSHFFFIERIGEVVDIVSRALDAVPAK